MTRNTLLRAVIICTGLVSVLNASDGYSRAVSIRRTCQKVCNQFEGLCMPEILDPKNVYQPHCTGAVGEKPPSPACSNCIKGSGLTPTSPKPTTAQEMVTPSNTAKTESVTKGTPETSDLPHTNCTSEGREDKCQKVCGNYSEICLPEWLGMPNASQPSCEDVNNVGKPNVLCLICLEANGLPDQRRPKCDLECYCHRLIIITLEIPTKSCYPDGQCFQDETTTPTRFSSDVSHCECETTEMSTCSADELTSATSAGYFTDETTSEGFDGKSTSEFTTVGDSEAVIDQEKQSTGHEVDDLPDELSTQPYVDSSTTSPYDTNPSTKTDPSTPRNEPSTTECICPPLEATYRPSSEPATEYNVTLSSEEVAASTTTSTPESLTAPDTKYTTAITQRKDSLPTRKPPIDEEFDYDDY